MDAEWRCEIYFVMAPSCLSRKALFGPPLNEVARAPVALAWRGPALPARGRKYPVKLSRRL